MTMTYPGYASWEGAEHQVLRQGTGTTAPAPAPTPTPAPTPDTATGETGVLDTITAQSATASVDAWAQSVGLGDLSGWINQQIQSLAGEGLSASDIASTINSTINQAPGFDALFPGYNQRIKNGFSNTDSQTGAGIAGYISYRQQIASMAEVAGLTPGAITSQDIGNAWANDVSASEMSTRITNEYVNAVNAMPQVQAELQNYGYVKGITPGQLASYYINPENTVNELQQQFNAAVAGTEGTLTGFGEIGQAKAKALQAFLTNGGQNNLSTTQAAGFFTGQLGSGLSSLSQMVQAGFENSQLGTNGGPGQVSEDQLLSAGEGNAQALADVRRAAETRSAASSGGGGLSSTQQGVEGVGFGSQ